MDRCGGCDDVGGHGDECGDVGEGCGELGGRDIEVKSSEKERWLKTFSL